jgi:hypothetical protein
LKVYTKLMAARDRIAKYLDLREQRWQHQLVSPLDFNFP